MQIKSAHIHWILDFKYIYIYILLQCLLFSPMFIVFLVLVHNNMFQLKMAN